MLQLGCCPPTPSFYTPTDRADFLDLTTWIDGDRIQHKPFVKAMSHRERIPWSSAHPLDVKRGTFSSELSRLATLCSDHNEYLKQCTEAVNLYIGRGYPKAVLTSWLAKYQDKRWDNRVADNNAEDLGANTTFFTLKTQFNEAWKSFNVGELQTRITAQWSDTSESSATGAARKRLWTGVERVRPQKRARVALQGQQWPGQSTLAFVSEDNDRTYETVRLGGSLTDNQSEISRQQVYRWSQQWVNTAKFLVSRSKNKQLWDLTRLWNKAVWDTFLEETGALRPFDPSYEGLVVPDENGE